MNILIIGPAWVGDMVMAQSLFKALKNNLTLKKNKEENEEIVIDVLAPEWSQPLLERMPEVHQSIPVALQHGELQLKYRIEIAQTLKNKYDQSIVLTNSWKSALIPWLAKIPKRTGWLGEMRFGLLNDIRRFQAQDFPRMVERFVMLAHPKNMPLSAFVSKIEVPKLETRPESVKATLAKFAVSFPNFPKNQILSDPMLEHPICEKSILALCPGAEFGSSKRWPEEYYAEMATRHIQTGGTVWIFGSKKDIPVSEKIKALIQIKRQDCKEMTVGQEANACLDFTGKTSLGEAIDLLSLVSAVISNDSGLMHIASALDKPLVAVYGSTDPGFTPPLHSKATIARLSELPCSPCFKRECPLKHHQCMQDLTPDIVWTRLKTLEQTSLEKTCGF